MGLTNERLRGAGVYLAPHSGGNMAEKREAEKQEGRQAKEEPQAEAGLYPDDMREAAERLPESDEVLKAYKRGFLAKSAQEEVQAKVRVVEESPRAHLTPSGHALKQVAGVGDDAERGEKYQEERSKVRHGSLPE